MVLCCMCTDGPSDVACSDAILIAPCDDPESAGRRSWMPLTE